MNAGPTGFTSGRVARRIAAAVMLAAGLASAPALAQWYAGDEPIPARAVVMRLLRQGFSGVSHPRFDGSVYTVEATNASGNRVRLLIDAFEGDVIARRRLEDDLRPPLDVGPRRFGRLDPLDLAEEAEAPRRYGTIEQPPWSPGERPRYNRPDRVPFEEAPVWRERVEPPRERNAVRTEPPARKPNAVLPSSRPEGERASPETPATTPSAPPPLMESAKPAAPAPAGPPASAVIPAPAERAPESKPAATRAPEPPAPKPPASPGNGRAAAPESAAPNRSVRVIEGVTPVLPKAGEAKPAD